MMAGSVAGPLRHQESGRAPDAKTPKTRQARIEKSIGMLERREVLNERQLVAAARSKT